MFAMNPRPVARYRPSGLKATALTFPELIASFRTILFSAMLEIATSRMMLPPVAIYFPSGEMAPYWAGIPDG